MSEVTDQKPTGPRRGIGVLAESLNKDLRLVSEEVVGAEILATKEVIENIGIFLDTLERLDNIRVEQVRWFFEDFATTYKRFEQSQDFPYVVTDHCQQRLEYVADGFQQVSQAVTQEISIFEQILFSLWKPFFAVVERDWKAVR